LAIREPLFSICIPTFNRREMLCQAIRSALNQTYDHIEVVVSDNASDDGTSEAVRALGDARIRYFRNETNLGAASNWERCLYLAQGAFISWLQDDDLLLPHFASNAVAAMAATGASCAFAACLQTSTPSSLAGASLFGTALTMDWCSGQPLPLPLSLALPLALVESSGIPPAMAFRVETIRRIAHDVIWNGYPLYAERMPIVHCAALSSVVIVPAVCGIFRSHPGQYSRALLCDTASARQQYESFLQALQDIGTRHEVVLDDFARFLATAPDVVLERFHHYLNSRHSSTCLFHEVRQVVRCEHRRRGFAAIKHRIWGLCRDITPPFLARLLDGTIQKLGRRLGI